MECNTVISQLEGYIRKSIDSSLCEDIKDHISKCRKCQEEEKVLRYINKVLEEDRITAPSGFTEDVMNVIMDRSKKKDSSFHMYRWGMALAAAGILMLILNVGGISLDQGLLAKLDKGIVAVTNQIGNVTESIIDYSNDVNSLFKDSIKVIYKSVFKEVLNNGE